jgi:hypothetical protein
MSTLVKPILPREPQEHIPLHDKSRVRPFIRPATFDDYDQIAAVESRHGLTIKSRDQWLALWLDNPAYLELPDWPIGWVIEDGAGQIVGSLGNVPTFVYFGGEKYVSAAGRGWAVDVPFRALSVMLLARQLQQSGADINVIATPSPTTAALCSRLGWSKVPVGEWDRSQFWVANYASAVQGYLDAKLSNSISKAFGAILSPPLRLKDSFAGRRSVKSDYRFDWCTSFDDRFDAMWSELKEQRPDLLLGSRDSNTLRWHFKHSLEQDRTWILTASRGTRLVGYAVFERREVQSLDLKRALLIDFQTLLKDPELSGAMIHQALARCRFEGVHVLENMGCWLEKLQPVAPPPHNRNLETWCYLYRVANPELERSLRNANCWYPTQYDGDASL